MKKIGYFILTLFAGWLIAYEAVAWVFYGISRATQSKKLPVAELENMDLLVSVLTITVSIYTIQSSLKRLKMMLDMNKGIIFWNRVRSFYDI